MTLNLPLLYFFWTEEYCQTNTNKKQIARPLTHNKHLSRLYFCLGCSYFSSVSHFKRVILRFTSYYHSNCYFEWSVSSDYSGPFSVPNQQKNISFYVCTTKEMWEGSYFLRNFQGMTIIYAFCRIWECKIILVYFLGPLFVLISLEPFQVRNS